MSKRASFRIPTSSHGDLLDQVAQEIVRRRLTAPAILFLESMKPLSFLGGQFMAFISPFVHMVVDTKHYDAFAEAIERRENVEYLIRRLEERSAGAEQGKTE